jgi:hypothetical protein
MLAIVYENHVLKIKCHKMLKEGCGVEEDECGDFKFGTLIDLNFVEYEAKEIHFKTPADHKIDDKNFDMEI